MQQAISNRIRREIFADPEIETFECAAGTPQLNKFLETGTLGKGFAVLSSLSVYCKGSCYVQKLRDKRRKHSVEYRVDISDISRVTYVRTSQNWLFVLCLVFGLLAPVLLLLSLLTKAGEAGLPNLMLDAGICAILAVIFALEYSLRKKQLLQFTYSNGSIALDTGDLDPKEEQILVKRLGVLRGARSGQE